MLYNIKCNFAGVVELADAPDSKSGGSDTMRVRPPPPAPKKLVLRNELFLSKTQTWYIIVLPCFHKLWLVEKAHLMLK